MKTTTEGSLMNSLRLIPRSMVKALAAGAVLIAAALPLAAASVASAAGAPVLTSATFDMSFGAGGNGSLTGVTTFGSGASGTITVTGTGYSHDGGAASLVTSAPGVTFTSVSESSTTTLTASFSSTAATVPGSYSLTLTDDAGTSAALSGAFTVDGAPALSSTTPLSLTSLSQGNPATAVTISGTGFDATNSPYTKATFTSTVNGTTLTTAAPTVHTATTSTLLVTPTNSVNSAPATPGTYTLTLTNPDGGTVTSGPIFSVTAYGISSLSPSALPVPSSGSVTTSVAIAGAERGDGEGHRPAQSGR